MTIKRRRGGRPLQTKAHAHGIDDETLYTPDELEFMLAVDNYKRSHRRPFPTWSEVFAVFVGLGYAKVEVHDAPGAREKTPEETDCC